MKTEVNRKPPTIQQRWNRPAENRSVTVGTLTVTYIPDGYVQLDPARWFSLAPGSKAFEGHEHLIADEGYLTGSIGSLHIQAQNWSLLIDAGYGPRQLAASQSHPSLGAMHGGGLASMDSQDLERLSAVAFTHLHDDHVGWLLARNTAVGDLLRAKNLYASSLEIASSNMAGSGGLWKAADDGKEIFPGVTAIASPGHTAGHTSYLIESENERLLCFGDVMHSPIQVASPTLNSCFESHPQTSLRTRSETLTMLSEPHTLAAGMHFSDVVFGRLEVSAKGSSIWVPEA